jgi:hypothetical protein
MALQRAVYRPRDAEHTVLHQVVAEHLEAFLGAVAPPPLVPAHTPWDR